ncbi:MAG TPA: SDR family oxidoreductase [Actinophytocola sp.]|nr:SDR family oxidoreductase [Actinophytocola sp.]
MSQDAGLLGISTEQFDRVFKTNIYAMFWLCTKAAIVNFTKALSADLVSRGIRANAVAPGPVWPRSSRQPCPRARSGVPGVELHHR